MESLLKRTDALRAEAWGELMASQHFAAFKALDDAVVALGGPSIVPSAPRENVATERASAAKPETVRRASKRVSHADAAVAAIRAGDEPLPIGRLMEAAVAQGAVLGGDNALSNFRSAVSKDNRLRSIMRNGMYFWWLTASPVPQKWKEAADPDLLDQSAASLSSVQEGGESHAATTSLN